MDYKYIEQLLERYWNCETSVEEERILRSFFRGNEIPANLSRYKALFACLDEEKEMHLGTDFDAKVSALVKNPPVVKAGRLTLRTRFAPLFKAAAVIALLFVVGTVAQHSMEADESEVVATQEECRDTATDPQVAYEPVLPIDTVIGIGSEEPSAAGKGD